MGIIMDKIENNRMKQIEADLGQSRKANSNQASDAIVVFPEKVRNDRRRLDDLRKMWDYLELLFFMLSDAYNRRYPIPIKTVIVGTVALLYLISPIDISPDIIPLIGFVDDIALLIFAASLVRDDLDKYRTWKTSN
jgi:uncharacterized membrane protein YkvA (DUF1232 family)